MSPLPQLINQRDPNDLLVVSREYGNILYRDYDGIVFAHSLLTTSKHRI